MSPQEVAPRSMDRLGDDPDELGCRTRHLGRAAAELDGAGARFVQPRVPATTTTTIHCGSRRSSASTTGRVPASSRVAGSSSRMPADSRTSSAPGAAANASTTSGSSRRRRAACIARSATTKRSGSNGVHSGSASGARATEMRKRASGDGTSIAGASIGIHSGRWAGCSAARTTRSASSSTIWRSSPAYALCRQIVAMPDTSYSRTALPSDSAWSMP
jgi:hypothetical protein